jgi:stage II sporulation protein D
MIKSWLIAAGVWFSCGLFALVERESRPPIQLEQMFNVRVLLAQEEKSGVSPDWTITSDAGFNLTDPDDPDNFYEVAACQLNLTVTKGKLAVNGKRLAFDSIAISPKKGNLKFCGNIYEGSFVFVRIDRIISLINSIDLEDYLFSVLRWESWPGWPLEVNKAFAIMCRTYVVNKVVQERKKRRPFDIKSTNIHQTYRGTHSFTNLRHALHETHGMIMAYNGEPIVAMYDSCCGGIIPARMDGVDFIKAPYLARDYACTYCKKSKLYAWRLEYELSDFEDLLHADLKNAVPISDICIGKKDAAGVVHEVVVTTNSAKLALSGKRIYSLLKDVKSLCFSVTKKWKKVVFQGNGYGHHLGLCQWGARQMVRDGWKYKDILRFYYPGITFMKVEVV